jgi:hypothetical protein
MGIDQSFRRLSRPAVAAICGAIAGVLTGWSVEELSGLEEGHGTLTGPFIELALIGSAVLVLGAVAQLRRPRTGVAASLFGLVLILPWFSWLFAAGAWCSALGSCHGDYPLLRFDPYSVVCATLALISIALQSDLRRG